MEFVQNIGTRVSGFKETNTQMQLTMVVNLPPITQFQDLLAVGFVQKTFSYPVKNSRPLVNHSGQPLSKAEARYLSVSCELARLFLRMCGVPTLDIEQIKELAPPSGKSPRQMRLSIPVVDYLPPRIFLTAYQKAFTLGYLFTRQVDALKHWKAATDPIGKELIAPISKAVDGSPRGMYLLAEAYTRGLPMLHLGRSVYQIGVGAQSILCYRSSTSGDSVIGGRIASRKHDALRWLRLAGMPTPISQTVTSEDHAQELAGKIGYPVVLKPADRERGEGVTLDIQTFDALKAAYAEARKFSDDILIENRIPGHCNRLVTFRGKFVFAFTRYPPAIVGDGITPIKLLIETINKKGAERADQFGYSTLPLDDEAIDCLSSQGLGPDAVAPKDQVVLLRHAADPRGGGHNHVCTDQVHPDNIRLVERIARMMRLESMGIDLITTDPAVPWHENGAAVVEVNAMPQIGENSARAYIEAAFPKGQDPLPIECFVGDSAAHDSARIRHAELTGQGIAATLITAQDVIGPDGQPEQIAPGGGLFDRTLVVMRDRAVEALIIVLDNDEWAIRGRPMPQVTRVEVVNESIGSVRTPGTAATPEAVAKLLRILEAGQSWHVPET